MKVLFEEGDWRLISDEKCFPITDVQHHCAQPYGSHGWWYFAYDGSCGVCHKEVPAALIGLRNLHRWNR